MGCNEISRSSKVYLIPINPDTGLDASISEDSSCILKFIIYDPEVKEPIPNSAISTAVLTLYNDSDQSIIQIGGSDTTDVKPNVDGVGQFRFVLEGQYNGLVTDDEYTISEIHWANFVFTFTAGSDTHVLNFNYQIKVENNKLVDQP